MAPNSAAEQKRLKGGGLRIIPLIAGLFVLFLGLEWLSERVFQIPVPSAPHWGERLSGTSAVFQWNYFRHLPRHQQQFNIQISRQPDFKEILYTHTTRENRVAVSSAFTVAGPYYYRVRALVGGTAFGWTRPLKFFGPILPAHSAAIRN